MLSMTPDGAVSCAGARSGAIRLQKCKLGLTVDPRSLIYVLGRETIIVSEKGRMSRITEPLFALLTRNVRSATDDLGLPIAQVVELGMQVDL
jgi:KUP system potassium uptake protein